MPTHEQLITELGHRGRRAARALAESTAARRNEALREAAGWIRRREAEILAANQADLTAAETQGLEHGAGQDDRPLPGQMDGPGLD